ncbi:protein apnoia [Lutzomyia longipalpis]|uniref:Secreted protein n=1 Tax=Lutzomyia longipalpis TaxID=7200 RepID=A0A1B0CJP2_LUTLO|nr:protein apnoia [Lutzomyia longipalpis]
MPSVQKFMISGVILFFILSVDLCLGEESTLSDASVGESRTFGRHLFRRINFVLIPTAFVVGVIATLLATLTVISLKGLGVGVILLVLSIGQLLARGLPQLTTPPTTYAASPASIIYGRSDVRNPVWIEKDWTS